MRLRRGGRRSGGGGGRSGGGGGGGRRSGGSGGRRSGGSGGSGSRSGGSGGSGSRSGGGSGGSGGSGGGRSSSGSGHDHGGGDELEISLSEDGGEVSMGGRSVGAELTEDGGIAFEAGRSVDLPEVEREFPIAAVPGLNVRFTMEGSLGLSSRVSVGGSAPEASVAGTFSGGARVGLSYGIPDFAGVYLQAGPNFEAEARLTVDANGIASGVVNLELSASAEVGMRVEGLVDLSVELGRIDIGSFNGSGWTRDNGWQWGTFEISEDMRNAARWVQRAASAARSGVVNAGRRVASGLSTAWNWLTGG